MTMHISYAGDTAAASGTQYSLTLINDSTQRWVFYVYQKMPDQMRDVFSLAWFCSPYSVAPTTRIRFSWGIDYNFVWGQTGVLMPGVEFFASQVVDCNVTDQNTVKFGLSGGPSFSSPYSGPPEGSLVINSGADVPNMVYSVGIGMSGHGTFAVQAGTNLQSMIRPTPEYWIAAAPNMQIGQVLGVNTSQQNAKAQFPAGIYSLDCTMGQDNLWSIKSS